MISGNVGMARPMTGRLLASVFVILSTVALPHAPAGEWGHENPHLYPGSWYRISLGADGEYLAGDGHGYGGTWYHYPQSGWYRQWYYNQPYDPNRRGYLEYEVYITAIDRSQPTYVEIYFNWSTPTWSQLGLNRPPLPTDASTAEEEARYMASEDLYLVDNWRIGTIEPIAYHIIQEYNPEWVSIDIRGRNAHVFRGAMHKCIGAENENEGACCNRLTGDCTLTTEESCKAPLEWLGTGTSCDACSQWTGGIDFGDAPDSYRTLSTSDGARHTRMAAVFLGRTVDVEPEAKVGSSAAGDDKDGLDDEDGVAFTSPLATGEKATIEVTASTGGYLNAWVDFNQDGDFGDTGEQVFSDELLAPGTNNLSFGVPSAAILGATFARFRFNTRGLLDWYGPATDGEVEDYKISIIRQLQPQSNSGKGGLKWSQSPQQFDPATPFLFNGWSESSNLSLHQIVADDWRCDDDRPVTGFQWWGSFQGWTQPLLPPELPVAFHVAVWTGSPRDDAAKQAGFAHPDTLLWEALCTNWTWNVAGYGNDPRGLSDETCFQFTCLLSQDQWFHPVLPKDKNDVSVPTVYWLSIAALYDIAGSETQDFASLQYPWGWTTRPRVFGNGAVRVSTIDASGTNAASWPPSPGSQWLSGEQIEHPRATPWDLAFELLTNQGSSANDPNLAPVYRFWSDSLVTHFYTISEAEKDLLIRDFPHVWTFKGVAFYAYPADRAPVGAKAVYRFWSESLNRHFYTIREDEKQMLIDARTGIWALEGVAWYAFD